NRPRCWKWAEAKPRAARVASPRLPCAASGRPIAATWVCEKGAGMSETLYQSIAQSLAEYARCIDDDRLEEWPDHFHGDCLYKVTTAANHVEGFGPESFSQTRKGCCETGSRPCEKPTST